jgi:hypothetical protein
LFTVGLATSSAPGIVSVKTAVNVSALS